MELLWKKSLETEHPLIDAQHKELLYALSELHEACSKGKNLKQIGKAFDFFDYSASKHFFDEESLQIYYGYPGYAVHRNCHDGFKTMIREFARILGEKTPTPDLAGKTCFFSAWLLDHISNRDAGLALHIQKTTRHTGDTFNISRAC